MVATEITSKAVKIYLPLPRRCCTVGYRPAFPRTIFDFRFSILTFLQLQQLSTHTSYDYKTHLIRFALMSSVAYDEMDAPLAGVPLSQGCLSFLRDEQILIETETLSP